MTRDENWDANWQAIYDFVNTNGRNPSKHKAEDRAMLHWLKYHKRQWKAGKMDQQQKQRFEELLLLLEKHRRINQYAYRNV
jgi:hypothetical protein